MARPSFKPTAAQRKAVRIAAGSGRMTHEEMAIALGIGRSTLEKYFRHELFAGACRARIDVYCAMYQAAMRGSAAAQKAYLSHSPKPATPPAGKIGKKAQAQLDAQSAQEGTSWQELLGSTRRHEPGQGI